MKKFVFFLVLVSILILLIRFTPQFAQTILGIKPRSGISVLSQPSGAVVFIDDEEKGTTPYENKDLQVKEYLVKIEKDKGIWQGKVNLTEGTVIVVNRNLSPQIASSSGEVLGLEKGRGLTVVSNPSNADLEVDGKLYGKTPIIVYVDPGVHTILVSHPNFLKRSIRADLPEGFNLTVSVDLALSEADLTTVTTPVIEATKEVLVKSTPTGFLRIREKPSLSAKEVGRVKPGDSLILLEEEGEWIRIRTSQGLEGYVSSAYVEEKEVQ